MFPLILNSEDFHPGTWVSECGRCLPKRGQQADHFAARRGANCVAIACIQVGRLGGADLAGPADRAVQVQPPSASATHRSRASTACRSGLSRRSISDRA
jgi:hypothetical protein